MKKVLLGAISLCMAAAVCAAPLTSLAAEAPTPSYPEIEDSPLTFETLTDYAVASDTLHAFAAGNCIYVLKNEDVIAFKFGATASVTGVDYQQGKFYFTLNGYQGVYVLPDSADIPFDDYDTATGVTLQKGITAIQTLGDYAYRVNNGVLNIWNSLGEESDSTTYGSGNCSQMKIYNGCLYLMNSNPEYGHFICKVDGTSVTELAGENGFRYSNYELLRKVATGNAAELLKNGPTATPAIELVNIVSSSSSTVYATKVNLNALTDKSEYFSVENPGIGKDTRTDLPERAMLLCQTGNISLILIDGDCYIIDSAYVEAFTSLPVSSAKTKKATVNITDYAYSLPYLSSATRLFDIAPDDEITILAALPKDSYLLARDFYLIEKDGKTGYIAADAINGDFPVFDENDTSSLPEKNPENGDYIRTVVLVLVVVALALIGIGYITWVATAKHRQKAPTHSDAEELNGAPDDKDRSDNE